MSDGSSQQISGRFPCRQLNPQLVSWLHGDTTCSPAMRSPSYWTKHLHTRIRTKEGGCAQASTMCDTARNFTGDQVVEAATQGIVQAEEFTLLTGREASSLRVQIPQHAFFFITPDNTFDVSHFLRTSSTNLPGARRTFVKFPKHLANGILKLFSCSR